jgi:hypothetical protein
VAAASPQATEFLVVGGVRAASVAHASALSKQARKPFFLQTGVSGVFNKVVAIVEASSAVVSTALTRSVRVVEIATVTSSTLMQKVTFSLKAAAVSGIAALTRNIVTGLQLIAISAVSAISASSFRTLLARRISAFPTTAVRGTSAVISARVTSVQSFPGTTRRVVKLPFTGVVLSQTVRILLVLKSVIAPVVVTVPQFLVARVRLLLLQTAFQVTAMNSRALSATRAGAVLSTASIRKATARAVQAVAILWGAAQVTSSSIIAVAGRRVVKASSIVRVISVRAYQRIIKGSIKP